MNPEEHWEQVYRTKRTDEVSWFRQHLETSLALITSTGVPAEAPILDVGGGASTLVDDLIAAGYSDVTVLDISAVALNAAQERLESRARLVRWLAGDVTQIDLPSAHFRVWHDRAVFHFLIAADERRRYVEQVRHAVAPGGHVIIATFGPDGPERCSGLPTARYHVDALHREFGADFVLIDRREELHRTPGGINQQFVYCL